MLKWSFLRKINNKNFQPKMAKNRVLRSCFLKISPSRPPGGLPPQNLTPRTATDVDNNITDEKVNYLLI